MHRNSPSRYCSGAFPRFKSKAFRREKINDAVHEALVYYDPDLDPIRSSLSACDFDIQSLQASGCIDNFKTHFNPASIPADGIDTVNFEVDRLMAQVSELKKSLENYVNPNS